MNVIKILLYFLLMTSFITLIFNKKFEKSLIFSMLFSSFILYISQLLFITFNIGFYSLIIMCLVNIPLLFKEYKKDKLKNYRLNYFSNGFYAFLIFFIFVLIYDFKRNFSNWDEFAHWGVMIKQMLKHDAFYTEEISTLMIHKDYPPIFELYELLFVKLAGAYNESIIVGSMHLLEFSLFLYPLCEYLPEKKFNNYIKIILIPIIVLLTILTFDLHCIINSIYVDYVLGLIVSFSLFIILNTKKYDLFNIILFILSNSFLLLMKQMGLPLYLIICFFLILKLIIDNYKSIKKSIKKFMTNNIENILILIIILIFPLIFYQSWNIYISNFNINKQFKFSDIEMSKLYDIRSGEYGEKWQKETIQNYEKAIYTKSVTSISIKVGFLQTLIICLFILYFSMTKYYNKNCRNALLLSLIIGAIGYMFVMLNLYVFCFGSREGPQLASFERYMASYVLIIVFLALMIFIRHNNNLKHYAILFIILIAIQSPERLYSISLTSRPSMASAYKTHAKNIKKYTKYGDKIYIISPMEYGKYKYYIKYYLDDVTLHDSEINFNLSSKINSKEYYEKKIKNRLKNYDYIYIISLNTKFVDKYSFIFDSEELREKQMYKIVKEKDDVKLKLISDN